MTNAPAKDRSRLLLAAATAGSIVESFDWLIYAVLAPYFAHAIFPGDDPVASLLASYLVFAIGFLIRPIGAVIMGRIIDRQGRKFGLVVSVSMISVGALVIALTPSYDTIGVWAAVIVVHARLVQGLSMSGEQAAVGTYLLETAPRDGSSSARLPAPRATSGKCWRLRVWRSCWESTASRDSSPAAGVRASSSAPQWD